MSHSQARPKTAATQQLVVSSLLSRQQLRHSSLLDRDFLGERCNGVVLFVDVSGFTALTESFTREGRQGSEHLSAVIRDTFDKIIQATQTEDGDVIAFAGDAIWTIWPVFPDDTEPMQNALGAMARRATRAALQIQQLFLEPNSGSTQTLRIRVAIGAGELSLYSIAVAPSKVEFLVVGSAIDDAGAMGRRARPSDVVMSKVAAELLHGDITGEALDDGALRLTLASDAIVSSTSPAQTSAPVLNEIQPRRYLPQFLLESIDQGLFDWLAEFRTVSVLFIKLHETDSFSSDRTDKLCSAIRDIYTIVTRLSGERYQLLRDEKGLTCIVAFGLPSCASEDDATRAVHAALEIHQTLTASGISVSIACATGTVFCNVTGTEGRRAYVMTGSTLNLAARLMQSESQGVLCDHHTRAAAANHAGLAFEALPPRAIPGRSDAALVYRPSRRSRTLWPNARQHGRLRLVGRHQERLLLATTVTEFLSSSRSRIVVIEGEAGIGKSSLLAHFVEELSEHGITCLHGAGESLEASTNYRGIRAILRKLVAPRAAPIDLPEQIAHLKSCISDRALHAFFPLLSEELPIPLAENEATLALTEEGRAHRYRELTLGFLEHFALQFKAAIVIEDAQWLDDESYSWLLRAARRVHPLLIAIATRKNNDANEVTYQQLLRLSECQRITLSPLLDEEVGSLLCERLQVDALPSQVMRLVTTRASGNPFYSLELLYSLRDQELISIDSAQCAALTSDLSSLFDASLIEKGLPSTLHGVVSSRFDRLDLNQQLVLKVASVIGQAFNLQLLVTMDPMQPLLGDLEGVVRSLVDADFLRVVSDGPIADYAIGHALLQEAIYASIPFAQRRSLHKSVADWYQQDKGHASSHAILAHHYARGGELEKALQFLEAAGAEAQRLHSCSDAARCYARALEVFDEQYGHKPHDSATRRRATLELALGRAQVSWSKYVDAIPHLARGLELLGDRVPRSTIWISLLLFWELAKQLWFRIREAEPARDTRGPSRWLDKARAYEGLTECYFNTGLNLPCLYSALVSLNRAERAGLSAELARGYSSFGAILGFIPVPGAARAYCRRAMTVAKEVDDRAAQAWVAVATGVLEVGLGNWAEAERRFDETTRLGSLTGDARRLDDSTENRCALHYLLGRYALGIAAAEELLDSSRKRDDGTMQASALRGLAYGLIWTDQLELAAVRVAELQKLRDDELNRSSSLPHVDVHPLNALLHFRRGRFSEAQASATLGVNAITAASPMFYLVLFEYSTLSEVLLGLREQGFGQCASLSRKAISLLGGFARVFPIARPASLLFRGLSAQLDNRAAYALRLYTSALSIADSLELPYWKAAAHYRLSRSSALALEQRDEHRELALGLFTQIGDKSYRERLLAPKVS